MFIFSYFKNYTENINLFQKSKRIYHITRSTGNAGFVCLLGEKHAVKKKKSVSKKIVKGSCWINLANKCGIYMFFQWH